MLRKQLKSKWPTSILTPNHYKDIFRGRWVLVKPEYRCGVPRIHNELKEQGINCGRKRVERLMKKSGLEASSKKRFKVITTDSNHKLPICKVRADEQKLGKRRDGGWDESARNERSPPSTMACCSCQLFFCC
jgi:transposase InsO family protein